MKKQIPSQFILAISILIIGAGLVGGEYLLVKWYPGHRQRVSDETLKQRPYHNDALGVDIQIAEGLYGNAETFPNGVKITRSKFWSVGPSLTITSQPNPDQTWEFPPEVLAKWESRGVNEDLPLYHLEHTKINNRDAMMIRELRGRYMHLTARIISKDRILEADCSPGAEDETLYMEACDETLRSIKVAGPEPPPLSGVVELSHAPAAEIK
ncbi:MAG TPA: hypothetical protein VEO19_12535 [Terriglobia bacterium]|nr:hypothetical protein [Terriglobia bacterium]